MNKFVIHEDRALSLSAVFAEAVLRGLDPRTLARPPAMPGWLEQVWP